MSHAELLAHCTEAQALGEDAFRAGKSIKNNPYKDDAGSRNWLRGYRRAMKDDL